MAAKKSTTKRTATKNVAKSRRAPAKKAAPKKAALRRAPAALPSPTLAPYLAVNDAAGALAWYAKVFGAKEEARMDAPGGKILHARLNLGGAVFFLSDLFPGADLVDPSRAGTSVSLNVYHRDCERMWARAVENGAKVTMPLEDTFWGQRYGKLVDPFGHNWALSYKSRLSQAELAKKREAAMREFAQMG